MSRAQGRPRIARTGDPAPARCAAGDRVRGCLVLVLGLLLVAGDTAGCHARPPLEVPLQRRWHTLAAGETLAQVAARYRVPLDALVKLNAIGDPERVAAGTELLIPEAALHPAGGRPPVTTGRVRERGVTLRAPGERTGAVEVSPGAGQLGWPVTAALSSGFGWRDGRPHEGIDLPVPDGTPVQAAADGVVVYAGDRIRGYGRLVIVEHAGALVTGYAHNEALLVAEGERVARGQQLARSGHTGHVTAPHVHFEVRAAGRPVDPLPYLAPH